MQPIAGKAAAAIGLGLAVQWLAAGCGAEPRVRPNLLLVTVDAVRPDWLACYGSSGEVGGETCALAEHAALYEWAFTTAPSGAPAAASLLSSTYPTQHGVTDEPSTFLPYLGPPTLAELLRAGGYATAAFVSSPELNRSRAFDRGFDLFDDRRASPGRPELPSLVERLRGWTSATSPPWFAWVHLDAAHGLAETRDAARRRADYEAGLRRLDRQIARVLAWTDSDAPDAGILLVGLHGQSLGERRGVPPGHGSALSPEQIRVPLIWRPPRRGGGTTVGRRVSNVVSVIDVAPTLVEAAALSAPQSFEGRTLPHSEGAVSEDAVRAVFAEIPDAVAVIGDAGLGIFPRLLVRPASAAPPLGSPASRREQWFAVGPGASGRGDREPGVVARAIAERAALDLLRARLGELPIDWRRGEAGRREATASVSSAPAPVGADPGPDDPR